MQLIERRIGLLFAVFLLFLAIGGGRALWLGTFRADALSQQALEQQRQTVDVPARRGSIVDRHGTELAVSEPATGIAATPYLVKDRARTAAKLAPLLRADPGELERKLARRGGFVWLARRLPDRVTDRIRALKLPGLEFVPESERVYPRTWLASQVLGTVGGEDKGLSGLEYRYEKQLHGRSGVRNLVKDALGDAIESTDEHPTRPGAQIRLSLDANIQGKAEKVLHDIGRKYSPKGATAVVMDPRDSSILALANWPATDANDVQSAPPEASQNRAVRVTYEPGSTFKAFTVAAAMEERRVQPHTVFNLPPQLTIYDRTIRESHPRGAITGTTADILKMSSNIGAVLIGRRLGGDAFDRWVRRFGFGKPTGVDLPGEESGLVPRPQDYSGVTMANLPIGQGLAVTPMQMATAYAAIANGGVLRTPSIVESIGGKRPTHQRGRRILSRATARSVAKMLEGVLGPGGTASEAAIPGYTLSGKTGTAQKPENGGYSDTKYVASFTGFAPSKKPRLLVAVAVDEPKGDIYGGTVAAPAFRDITNYALQYLKIPPQ